jgi:hypothetical protein
MNHRNMLRASLIAFTLLEASCYPKAATAPPALSASGVALASARWPGVTEGALAAGHQLFVTKCNGCHDYPDLTAIPERRWPGILEKMAKKSHLNAEERDNVLHFVVASRSQQLAP